MQSSSLWLYSLVILISSAILMVIEITAGRLIAPYVGVSIYSWTAIIGVVLAGLSLGNWLGGLMADRGAHERHVGWILVTAALFTLLSLPMLRWSAIALGNGHFGLLSATLVHVSSMFFIPSVLLGIPTPLLTTLALKNTQRTGHVVGQLHALAAFGSIAGTFLTGFVLVQYLGSRRIVAVCALVLLLLSIPLFWRSRRSDLLLALLLPALLWWPLRAELNSPCDRETHYYCLRAVPSPEPVPFGNARALILDHLVHGINHEQEPGMLIMPYVQLMDELVIAHAGVAALDTLRWYFAGGGAYTLPRMLAELTPNATLNVAEIDAGVTTLAVDELWLKTDTMHIQHGDARQLLTLQKDDSQDVIITDAFHDIAVPYHLLTVEFARTVRRVLADDGLYLVNVVDAGENPQLLGALVRTLKAEFKHVAVWEEEGVPRDGDRVTWVISASAKALPPSPLDARRGFPRRWTQTTVTPDHPISIAVLRDDFVPVERLIAPLLLKPEH